MNSPTRRQSGTQNWDQYAKHRSRILHREKIARNVHQYILEKPDGFAFKPGQAVEMAIDQEGWRQQGRPFTVTSLPDNPRLQFTIKSYPSDEYPDHGGMTGHLGSDLQVNDRLIFGDAWGAIAYQGPGVFLAGGAGITPFIAILRQAERDATAQQNRLFASNRSADEVILQAEMMRILGANAVFTLTDQRHRDYEYGRIDRAWLEKRVTDFSQPFYVCGPPEMVQQLSETLRQLGVGDDNLVTEES